MLNKNGAVQANYCAPSSSHENSAQSSEENSNQNSEQALTTNNETESSDVRRSLLSANYLLTLFYFTLGNLRNVTFPAWYLPWLQWSIPEGEAKEDLIGKF